MDVRDLGEKIKTLRTNRGLTQHQIASVLGVSSQAVSKWERGENAPDLFIMPSLAALLNTSVDTLLGYELRTIRQIEGTIFFSSQHGYTAKSEKMSPEDMAVLLNSHFYSITECVLQRAGVPIKYIGDAFLAVFISGNHELNALEAALASREVSERPMAIGLVSGSFFMGPIGHPDFARIDVIGDYVNLAARIQAWAGSNTDSGIAATEETVASWIDRIDIGKPIVVEIKGKTTPASVCEVLGKKRST